VWRYPALRHLVVVDVAEEALEEDVAVVSVVAVEVVAVMEEEAEDHTVGDVEDPEVVAETVDHEVATIVTAVAAAPVEVAVGDPEEAVEAVIPEVVVAAVAVHATVAALLCPGEVAGDITTTAELALVPVDTSVEEIMATIRENIRERPPTCTFLSQFSGYHYKLLLQPVI